MAVRNRELGSIERAPGGASGTRSQSSSARRSSPARHPRRSSPPQQVPPGRRPRTLAEGRVPRASGRQAPPPGTIEVGPDRPRAPAHMRRGVAFVPRAAGRRSWPPGAVHAERRTGRPLRRRWAGARVRRRPPATPDRGTAGPPRRPAAGRLRGCGDQPRRRPGRSPASVRSASRTERGGPPGRSLGAQRRRPRR